MDGRNGYRALRKTHLVVPKLLSQIFFHVELQLDQPLQAGWLYLHAGEYHQVTELLGQSEVEAEKALAIGAAHALPEAAE